MDMRVVNELTAPGAQSAEKSEIGSQFTVRNILESGRAFLEKKVQQQALIGPYQQTQLLGHSESHQMIRHGEQPRRLTFDPGLGLALSALRTGAMAAAVERKVHPATGAAIHAAAALWGVTGQDGRHRRMMRGQDAIRAVVSHISRPMPTQDLRQSGRCHLAFGVKTGVKTFQCLSSPLFANGGEMCIDEGRFQTGMAQVLADQADGYALLQ